MFAQTVDELLHPPADEEAIEEPLADESEESPGPTEAGGEETGL
jgi:hypothetical protein